MRDFHANHKNYEPHRKLHGAQRIVEGDRNLVYATPAIS